MARNACAALSQNLQPLSQLQPLNLPQLLNPPQLLLQPPQLLFPLPLPHQFLPPLPHHTQPPQIGSPVQKGPTHQDQDHREMDVTTPLMDPTLISGLKYLDPATQISVHTMDGSSLKYITICAVVW